MTRFALFLVQLLFGLIAVVGVGLVVVGLVVEHSVAMVLVGCVTALVGLAAYNWLGE